MFQSVRATVRWQVPGVRGGGGQAMRSPRSCRVVLILQRHGWGSPLVGPERRRRGGAASIVCCSTRRQGGRRKRRGLRSPGPRGPVVAGPVVGRSHSLDSAPLASHSRARSGAAWKTCRHEPDRNDVKSYAQKLSSSERAPIAAPHPLRDLGRVPSLPQRNHLERRLRNILLRPVSATTCINRPATTSAGLPP